MNGRYLATDGHRFTQILRSGRWPLKVEPLLVQQIEIHAPDFDLAMTLDSGQVFHWQKAGNGFVGAIATQGKSARRFQTIRQ